MVWTDKFAELIHIIGFSPETPVGGDTDGV